MDVSKRLWLSRVLQGSACAVMYTNFPLLAQISSYSEEERRKSAEYIMTFASPYSSIDKNFCPHMHYELKRNIQDMSAGRVYVDIKDSGILGTGNELTSKVARGAVSAALISVSNLSPVAPELDILNIPFWSSKEQDYLNLVTSKAWKNLIIDKVRAQGKLDVLFHYLPGARTASSTAKFGKVIKRPDDIQGVIFRIPRSQTLKIFYELAGASTVSVNWKHVAKMSRVARIDALDPCVVGLYNGPNYLRNNIGAISQIQSVYDGWIAVVSQKWFNTLPLDLKLIIKDSAEKTFSEHLQLIRQVTDTCTQEFKAMGTKIYIPTEDEKEEWIARCGPNNKEWSSTKKRILGDEKSFQQLVEATQINNGYNVQSI